MTFLRHITSSARFVLLLGVALTAAVAPGAEVATDQRQVAIGYERLETLALRIADAVEANDPARADQIRTAIGEARTVGITDRFDKVVSLLERERYTAARRDQTDLATQLEELLRLVMADPNASRLEEERRRLEMLRREIRSALREQKSLRARAARGEVGELTERQSDLADRVERLREPAEATDRLSGRQSPSPPNEGDPPAEPPEAPAQDGEPAESQPSDDRSIAGKLQSGGEAMRRAEQKLGEKDTSAQEEQLQAQRDLEAAQREAEERLKQIREEEQQRRLASLAERLRRMHESQTGLVSDTRQRIDTVADDPAAAASRAARLAAAKLASRQGDVGAAAEQALRVVRADGSSRVFDEALSQAIDDIRSAESRLRDAKVDPTTLALEQSVVDALAEMIAAVDDSLDELEQERSADGQSQQGKPSGEKGLVSKIAELRMMRAIQARLLRQTEVWRAAAEAGEASRAEVAERLGRLAAEQRRLAAAADNVAGGRP